MADSKDTIKVLVVGGSSRAGTRFFVALRQKPLTFTSRRSRASPISDFPNEDDYHRGFISHRPSTVSTGWNVVINFAGMTHGRASAALFAVNAEGT